MNSEKFTQKSQEALSEAHQMAASGNHNELTPMHLMIALLSQEDGLVPRLLNKMGRDIQPLRQEAEVVYCHHERWDGLGYPQGLVAEEIPLCARLFSIVDAFDAITSDRPYRPAQGIEVAKRLIAKEAGRQFDPKMVEVFLKIPDNELEEIRRLHPDQIGETTSTPGA